MRKLLFAIAILGLTFFKVNAQLDFKKKFGMANIPSLNVGDQVPDFVIPKLINSDRKSIKISDFKDKLLVFDFWATWCGGCIAGLPKMDKLQKQFGDKVMMLPVTYESESHVLGMWSQNSYTKNLTIPSVVEDKIILSYFPHKAVPNEIWIYKGKVVAITEADYVNASNIEKILSGVKIDWPVKNDFYTFDGSKKALFKLDSNQININQTFIKYAAISDYKPNVGPAFLSSGRILNGIVRDSVNKTIRAFEVNMPIYNLYKVHNLMNGKETSLVKPLGSFPNEVIWEVTNKYKYIEDPQSSSEDWFRKNAICFESLNPDTGQTDQQVYQTMNLDMDRLLGLYARWEKRKEKVLVLVRTAQEDKLKSRREITGAALPHELDDFRYKENGTLRQFRYSPLSNLVSMLNSQESNPYVFDETGYTDYVDMDLNISSWLDISSIRKAIKSYGLDLKEEEKLVDKFVFTELNSGLLVDVEAQKEIEAKIKAQKDLKNPSSEEGILFLEANKKKSGVIVLPSGVQYKIIKNGTGNKPHLHDKVIINYTSRLVNGKIFDSTDENGRAAEPMSIDTEWERMKGLQEALRLMSVGSKWIIYLPSNLALANHTAAGRIPANSVIIYEVQLLNLIKEHTY